jgi:DNA-binding CsgD family transcriptional regulator
LTKPFGDETMLNVLRSAIQRSPAALERESELQVLRDRHDSLSSRERDVMALIVSGLMNKQVGGELGISDITVKAHRGNAMRKMEAALLADLVNMAAAPQITGPALSSLESGFLLRRITADFSAQKCWTKVSPTPSSNRLAPLPEAPECSGQSSRSRDRNDRDTQR